MSIEAAVKTLLAADGTIAGLVGTRFFYERVPQSQAFPCVLISDLTREHIYDVVNESAMEMVMMDITAYARDPGAAATIRSLGDAIQTVLSSYTGTVSGSYIDVALIATDLVISTPPNDGSDNWTQERRMTFRIFHIT